MNNQKMKTVDKNQ